VNRNTVRALMADARYQVFDNVVFRILLGVAALVIALSFMVAFGETSISLFFGTWEVDYTSLGPIARSTDPRAESIQFVQEQVVELITGTFGIMLCIAATAFFTPRMLEKGSADNIFSKPVGRFTLLLSRYISGLLFVALLSFVMVFGVQAGLTIVSDYNDWGFLWSAVTLIYVYATLQAFSILVATVTRSSVASILLTMMLFMFTGCVNGTWVALEWTTEIGVAEMMSRNRGDEEAAEEVASEEDGTKPAGSEQESEEDEGMDVLGAFRSTASAFRAVLPRTGDADILARKLRRTIEQRPDTITIREEGLPVFFLNSDSTELQFQGGDLETLDGEGLHWLIGEGEQGVLKLTRRPRKKVESRTGRMRKERTREIAAEYRAEIEAEHGPEAILESPGTRHGKRVDWRVTSDDDALPLRSRTAITAGDSVFEFEAHLPAGSLESDRNSVVVENTAPAADHPSDPAPEPDSSVVVSTTFEFDNDPVQEFLSGASFGIDPANRDPNQWYESRFGWNAPWDFNAFVSIGTSLGFAIVMLLLARWRLSRMDF